MNKPFKPDQGMIPDQCDPPVAPPIMTRDRFRHAAYDVSWYILVVSALTIGTVAICSVIYYRLPGLLP